MSDKPANSGSAVQRKQAATFLLGVGGGLGILKTAIDYTHTVLENSNLLLVTFYFIGVSVPLFIIAFCIWYIVGGFFTISLFGWLVKRYPSNYNYIHRAYLLIICLVAASNTLYALFTDMASYTPPS